MVLRTSDVAGRLFWNGADLRWRSRVGYLERDSWRKRSQLGVWFSIIPFNVSLSLDGMKELSPTQWPFPDVIGVGHPIHTDIHAASSIKFIASFHGKADMNAA
jgi:hypothetical protein